MAGEEVEQMREKRYDVVLWDVDGTLLNFLESEKWALKETFLSFGMEIDDAKVRMYSAINDSLWKRLERGEICKQDVLHGRFQKLFEEMQITQIDVTEFQITYQRNFGSVYFYMDDSLSLCKKLNKDAFQQYIITNGVEWTQRNKLHLAGFDEVMDDIFISEVIGYDKPDVRFFDLCLQSIEKHLSSQEKSLDRGRILVIGDSMTSDMKGAQNAGLDCCLYAPKKNVAEAASNESQTGVTYQISYLWDVEDILWQNQKDKN